MTIVPDREVGRIIQGLGQRHERDTFGEKPGEKRIGNFGEKGNRVDKADADHLMPEDRPAGLGIMCDLRRRIVDELGLQPLGLFGASGLEQVARHGPIPIRKTSS